MPSVVLRRSPLLDAVPVESSLVAEVAYDNQRAILQVKFRDGAVYRYSSVPPQTYWDLLRAESKGIYFNQRIRSCFQHAMLRAPDHVHLKSLRRL